MKEILFRTRKGAAAWAKSFHKETGFLLMVRRDPAMKVFSRTKGCWILEIPEDYLDAWAGVFGKLPHQVNQWEITYMTTFAFSSKLFAMGPLCT